MISVEGAHCRRLVGRAEASEHRGVGTPVPDATAPVATSVALAVPVAVAVPLMAARGASDVAMPPSVPVLRVGR